MLLTQPLIASAQARNPVEFEVRMRADFAPRLGTGEELEIRNPFGRSNEKWVSRLHVDLGDDLVVLLPTGELSIVPRKQTRAPKDPFKRATKGQWIESLRRNGLENYKLASRKPYVYVYSCSESFFERTSGILNSLYPGIVKSMRDWGMHVSAPKVPMIVVILPNRAAYDKYRKEDGDRFGTQIPDSFVAYYNALTNYIVLYEDPNLAEAAPEFDLKKSAYMTVHEGVHQIFANIGIQHRLSSWPMWVSEGLPEYFSPIAINVRLTDRGKLPKRALKWTQPGMVNDLRMYELLTMSPDGGRVIERLSRSKQMNSKDYAMAWGLVHYLAEQRPEAFRTYLREVSSQPPFSRAFEADDARQKLFIKYFGADFAELESQVQEHLNTSRMLSQYKDPVENQTYFVVRMVGARIRNEAYAAPSPQAVKQWKDQKEEWLKKNKRTAKFITSVCKSKSEAERDVMKIVPRRRR